MKRFYKYDVDKDTLDEIPDGGKNVYELVIFTNSCKDGLYSYHKDIMVRFDLNDNQEILSELDPNYMASLYVSILKCIRKHQLIHIDDVVASIKLTDRRGNDKSYPTINTTKFWEEICNR